MGTCVRSMRAPCLVWAGWQASTMEIRYLQPDGLVRSPAFSRGAVIPPGATMIYIGGQNGVDESGQVVASNDVAAQAVRAVDNVETVLRAAGATLADVVTWPRPTVRSLRGSPAPEHLRSLPLHVLLALRCPGRSWRSAQSRHSRRIDFALGTPSGHEDGKKKERTNAALGSSRKLVPDAVHIRASARPTARTAADPCVASV